MKTVKIIGKGQSLTDVIKVDDNDNYVYAVLNSSIRLIDGVADYHFMNDFENLNKIGSLDLIKTKNLIIPSFPHIHEKANIDYTHEYFIDLLPKCYNAHIFIYELYTAPIKGKFESLDVTWSVLETALRWFIKRGYRKFELCGVTENPGYSKLIYWEKPSTHQNNVWLKKNISIARNILDTNDCEYTFA